MKPRIHQYSNQHNASYYDRQINIFIVIFLPDPYILIQREFAWWRYNT